MDPAAMLTRSVGVAKLDVPTYEAVEADESLTQEAGIVVVLAAVIGSIGGIFTGGLWLFLAGIIATLVGWFVWAWVSAFIAEKLFKSTTTNTGEMLRTTGYAQAPRALGLIPFLGFIGLLWSLVCVVIGVRQAGELSTGQAIITAVLGWLPTAIATGMAYSFLT